VIAPPKRPSSEGNQGGTAGLSARPWQWDGRFLFAACFAAIHSFKGTLAVVAAVVNPPAKAGKL